MGKGNFKKLINSQEPVLVDFYADWCGPCKAMSPVLQQVSSDVHGEAKVIKINVDKNQHAAQQYGVRSIPTLILFKAGKPLWRHSGTMDRNSLTNIIKKHV